MSKLSKLFLLMGGISVICFAVSRMLFGYWVPFLWIPIGLSLFFFVGIFWIDRALFAEFLSVKTTKQGLSMGSLILLVIVFLVTLNFIAARKYKTWDFSATKVNTLSEQSITLLKNLSEDLHVYYFYKEGEQRVEENKRAFIDLLKKYQDQSSFVKLEFVELNENPDMAAKFEVNKGTGLVFLEYKGRKNRLDKIDEQEVTGALVKVTREKDKTVYIVSGHSELSVQDTETKGLAFVKQLLEGNRYIVKPLSLLSVPRVPDDADVLLIAGPSQSYFENELKLLEDYLITGGALIIAVDSQKQHQLQFLLDKVGLRLRQDLIVHAVDSPLGRAINPAVTPITDFSKTNAITKPFERNESVSMRLPTSIEKVAAKIEGLNVDEFLKASANVLGFKDTSFKGEISQGPFTVGALVTGKWTPAASKDFKLVLYGDAEFMSNQMLYQHLNRDLFLNSVSYLADEENAISITPKEIGITKMELTDEQFYFLLFGFMLPVPALFLVASATLWHRRRYA